MSTLTTDDARRLFLSMLIARSYDGAIKITTTLLEEDSSLKQLSPDFVALRTWFNSLDDKSRLNVQMLIQRAVDSSVFGSLVLLDGLTGGNPIRGTTSDFALYLQTYENDELRGSDIVEHRIRLNHPELSEFLHDLYRDMIEERT